MEAFISSIPALKPSNIFPKSNPFMTTAGRDTVAEWRVRTCAVGVNPMADVKMSAIRVCVIGAIGHRDAIEDCLRR